MQTSRLLSRACGKSFDLKTIMRNNVRQFASGDIFPRSARYVKTKPTEPANNLTPKGLIAAPQLNTYQTHLRQIHTDFHAAPPALVRSFFIYLQPHLTFERARKTQEATDTLIRKLYSNTKEPFFDRPAVISESPHTIVGQHAIHFSMELPAEAYVVFNVLDILNAFKNASIAIHYYNAPQFHRLRLHLESGEHDVEGLCKSTVLPPSDKRRFIMQLQRGIWEEDLEASGKLLQAMNVEVETELIPTGIMTGNVKGPVAVLTLPSDRLDAIVALKERPEFTACEDADVITLAKFLDNPMWHAHTMWMEFFGKDE
ncbi:Hypothetical predicted protein [Lecanosticta acicola]|uniref:Uncharacterized protein n=1 Tax=Lecanosticta acicola TaxID=111012 RepID=A0AAI8YVJ5_9PEZI|nr:Hypothetical predicted protein [Lecanosticta acicola]